MQPTSPLSERRRRMALAVVAASAFFLSVDLTFVNVALPDIGRDLGASVSGLAWVVDTYNVALTGMLLLGAALAERLGRRRVFLGGLTLFTLASLLAGLSPDLAVLLAARVLMGIGAGLLLAPALAITAMVFPPGERARAVATWSSAGAIGLAVGPVFGGIIVGTLDWRWAFLLTVPFLAAATVVGFRVLPEGRADATTASDWTGAVLSVVALVPLVAALIEAPHRGWADPAIVACLLAGLLLLAAFVVRELRTRQPVLDVRMLRRAGVLGASVALFASYIAFMGILFLVSLEAQLVAGIGALAYGLLLAPRAIAYWLTTRVTTRLIGAGRGTPAVAAGLALMFAAFAVLAVAPASVGWTLVALVLDGVGAGLAVPVGVVVVLNDIPATAMSTASGLSVTSRFAGSTIGVAVLASVVVTAGGTLTNAIKSGYIAGALMLLALGPVAVAALLRRRRHDEGVPAPGPG